MNISMPNGAKTIIDKLYADGYEAFIVGGCVRDALLGKAANDFDITTSAMPEAVKEILEANAPRTARVETAPPRGLFLWKVFY